MADGSTSESASFSSSSSSRSSTISSSARTGSSRTASTKPKVARRTGSERYKYEHDRSKRLVWANKQIKQVQKDLMRLEMTTGTISNFSALPETGNAVQYSSGNRSYGDSLLAFANIVSYMQKGAQPEVNFSVNDVCDRMTHRGGLRSMRRLLSSLSECGLSDSDLDSHYEVLQGGLVRMPIHELQGILAPHLRTAMDNIKKDLEQRSAQVPQQQQPDMPLAGAAGGAAGVGSGGTGGGGVAMDEGDTTAAEPDGDPGTVAGGGATGAATEISL